MLFAVAGVILLFAPLPEQPSLSEITQAAQRQPVNDMLLFPKFNEYTSARITPFEFEDLPVADVAVRAKQSEPSAQAPPPSPPKPKPDTQGLILVGTAPGNAQAFALVFDEQSGLVTTYVRGDAIRNAVLKEVYADRIIVSLDQEHEELALTPVNGSDNLSRQLQGLPPLPQTDAPAATPAAPPPAPQQTGVAVLAGTAQAGRARVISQGAAMATQTSILQNSSSASSDSSQQTPQASSQQNTQASAPQASAPQASAPQASAPQASAPQASTSQASAPQASAPQASAPQTESSQQGSSSSSSRPSLGISGHMLTHEMQQELGLESTGLLVTAVRRSNSPIQVNDVLLAIDGQAFDNVQAALALIKNATNNSVQVQVSRDGSPMQFTVNLQ